LIEIFVFRIFLFRIFAFISLFFISLFSFFVFCLSHVCFFAHYIYLQGVFNVVNGKGSTIGMELVRHPKVSKIAFTGSTR
jgi:hypothetical protein